MADLPHQYRADHHQLEAIQSFAIVSWSPVTGPRTKQCRLSSSDCYWVTGLRPVRDSTGSNRCKAEMASKRLIKKKGPEGPLLFEVSDQ